MKDAAADVVELPAISSHAAGEFSIDPLYWVHPTGVDNFGDQFVRPGAGVQNALLQKLVLIFWLRFLIAKSAVYSHPAERAVKLGLQVMPDISSSYMGTIFNSPQKYRAYA